MTKTNFQIICENCGLVYDKTTIKVAKFISQPMGIDLSEITNTDIRNIIKTSIKPCPPAPDTTEDLTNNEKLAFRKVIETGIQYYLQISKTLKL